MNLMQIVLGGIVAVGVVVLVAAFVGWVRLGLTPREPSHDA